MLGHAQKLARSTSYRDAAQLARDAKLRNADPEIARIAISDRDFAPLNAFVRALHEDYE